eukprot:TRINITY_DN22715_c0_g1_i1.p1 TRINITY_DN22715_c0_g1~~TRINITY_DN22715_c0_g1_i1.p1  ORF type:complete len:459 (+),score=83.34 TRINITY_DN22715_c0_g1_i1:108-1484(+)
MLKRRSDTKTLVIFACWHYAVLVRTQNAQDCQATAASLDASAELDSRLSLLQSGAEVRRPAQEKTKLQSAAEVRKPPQEEARLHTAAKVRPPAQEEARPQTAAEVHHLAQEEAKARRLAPAFETWSSLIQLKLERVQLALHDASGGDPLILTCIIACMSVLLAYCFYATCLMDKDGATQNHANVPATASRLLTSQPAKPSRLPTQQLLSEKQMYSSMAGGAWPPSSVSMKPATGLLDSENNWYSEMPEVYRPLVLPSAPMRLAVPLMPLSLPEFALDVLGWSGKPLLMMSLVKEHGTRNMYIALDSNAPLARVSSAKEVFSAQGVSIGKLVQDDIGETAQHILRDNVGRPMLAITSSGRDRGDLKMTSMIGGRVKERATMARQPPTSELPAEHYLVVANPNVDAVLALACFLAVVVFRQDSARSMTQGDISMRDSLVRSQARPSVPPMIGQSSSSSHW